MSPTAPKTVLITGCSNGSIGSALAKSFSKRGHHVFASVRNPSKASDLSSLPNVKVLTLNVASQQSINACLAIVQQELGLDRGLDILINNAGHGLNGPLLDVDIDEAKKTFDVNVWGVLAMTQAFAPLLVEASGTVINISSVGSLIHTPYIGVYSASKGALTMLSDTLRVEMAALGVRVITVMTGMISTYFHDNLKEVVLPEDSYYKAVESSVNATPGQKGVMENIKMPLDKFAEALVRDVLAGKRGKIYRGGMSLASWWFKFLMPTWLLVGHWYNTRLRNCLVLLTIL